MKETIQRLVDIRQGSDSTEEAAKTLSREIKRFSTRAAKKVMLDVEEYIEGVIDESKLSLYLQSHGF